MGVLTLFMYSCWDKQDIDIVPAPVPVYTLNGYITDIDTGDSLAGIPIKLKNHSTAHPDYDTTAYDTTDENGYYEYFDVVSPGEVYLYAFKNGYQVYYKLLILYWNDRQFDFMIPKLALAEPYNINLPEGNIAGIAWKDTNTLAIINGTTVFKVVWESMTGAPFQRITESTDPMYYRDYKALDFDGKNYVAVSDPGRIISEDDTTFFDGEYYFLSPNNQSIIKYYSLPVSPYRIRDISEKDGDVFISAETRLVRWNVESGDTLVVFDPTAWYTGITAGDSFVYVYNDDFYSKYIIRMDNQFNPQKTYAVMSKGSTSNRLELRYLDVDENGDLWAFDRSLKSIYKIKLDNE